MNQRYILHNNFSAEIDEYQKRLVREVAEKFGLQKTLMQNIPAHFTLKYWFEADEGDLVQIDRMLGEFSEVQRAAPVFLSGVSGFSPKVVFLDVQLSPEAKHIFDSLIRLLKAIEWLEWDRYDAPNLHFHSTIAEGCGEYYQEVLEYLQSRHSGKLSASFSNITVTRQVGLVKELILLSPYRIFNFA